MLNITVGAIVHMKKPHPCGSLVWRITRIGPQVHLCCLGCGREVILPHSALNKRAKRVQPAPNASDEPPTK